KQVCTSLKHALELLAERLVHEGVDDRVGHVIQQVRVEHDGLEGDQLRRHQPGGHEAGREHDRHHEQHHGRADVGQEVKVPPLAAAFLLGGARRLDRRDGQGQALAHAVLLTACAPRCLHDIHAIVVVVRLNRQLITGLRRRGFLWSRLPAARAWWR
ncbi:hypothetical protein EGW08_016898, partial [Elysia chlorotica]